MTQTNVLDAPTQPTQPTTMKGWHTDPEGQHKFRFHDGGSWTVHTTHYGPVPCTGCAHLGE